MVVTGIAIVTGILVGLVLLSSTALAIAGLMGVLGALRIGRCQSCGHISITGPGHPYCVFCRHALLTGALAHHHSRPSGLGRGSGYLRPVPVRSGRPERRRRQDETSARGHHGH